MKTTERDLNETKYIGKLMNQLEHITPKEVSEISDRIGRDQPFIISLLLGYRHDVKNEHLNDILKILFLIFLFFENKTNIKKKKVSSEEYDIILKRNFRFLEYYDGEPSESGQMELNEQYISHLRFRSLFVTIITIMNQKPSLKTMDDGLRGNIVIGMKTLIDCLESSLLD